MEDVVFFKRIKMGQLRQLGKNAPDSEILTADSTTLKLDDKKMGIKEYASITKPTGQWRFDMCTYVHG